MALKIEVSKYYSSSLIWLIEDVNNFEKIFSNFAQGSRILQLHYEIIKDQI